MTQEHFKCVISHKSTADISSRHLAACSVAAFVCVSTFDSIVRVSQLTCLTSMCACVCVCAVLVFQVIIQNRYKFNKKYRRLAEAALRDPDNSDIRHALAEAKVSQQLSHYHGMCRQNSS